MYIIISCRQKHWPCKWTLEMLYRHKLCMVVVATGHYHFIPIWVTLTAFQGNRSNGEIQMVVCASSVLLTVLVLLHVYTVSALTLHYILLLTPICWKSSITNTRLMAFTLSLTLDPTFGIHSHKTFTPTQPCHLLNPNWKHFFSHSSTQHHLAYISLLGSVFSWRLLFVLVMHLQFFVQY